MGIMGGKRGASTYIVGVQDDQALYLDPHEVQQVCSVVTIFIIQRCNCQNGTMDEVMLVSHLVVAVEGHKDH
jgi:hypothetical protein